MKLQLSVQPTPYFLMTNERWQGTHTEEEVRQAE